MPETEVASFLWNDKPGNAAVTRMHILPALLDADLLDLANDVQPLSDMRMVNVQRTRSYPYTGVAASELDDDHQYADDLASLQLAYRVSTTQQLVFISIPGPKQALITENNFTIDPENAAFDALNLALAAVVTTAEGDAAGQLEAGRLQKARTPRPR